MTQPFIGQGVPKDESSIPRALSGLQRQINEMRVRRGSYSVFQSVADQTAMLALAALPGDMALRADVTATFVLTGNDPTVLAGWVKLPSASGHTIEDEGTPLATRTNLNFVGAAITATDDAGNDRTNITVDAIAASLGANAGDLVIFYGGAWHVLPVGTTGQGLVVDTSLAAKLKYAALSTGNMTWQGAWSSVQSYNQNDVVTQAGKLWLCTTSYTAGAAPSYVGASTLVSASSAGANMTLPTGTIAGDLMVLSINTYSGAQYVLPTGFTPMGTGGQFSDNYIVGYKTITAADITAGNVTLPTQTGATNWCAIAKTFRNFTQFSNLTSNLTLTTSTVTPGAYPSIVLQMAFETHNNGFTSTWTQAAVTALTQVTTGSGAFGDTHAMGYDTLAAGTSTARVFTVTNGLGNTASAVAYSLPPTFDSSKWVEIGDDVQSFFVAKGDTFAGTSVAGVGAKITVGTDGFAYTADSGQSAGIGWRGSDVRASVNTVAASGTAQTIPDPITAQNLSRITLNNNCTFTFPTAAVGKRFRLVLTQDGTGGRTATWPGTVKWPSATAPTLSAANKTDAFEFQSYDGTNWWGRTLGANYS